MSKLAILLSLFLSMSAHGNPPNWSDLEWRHFFDTLREKETGNQKHEGLGYIGDNGQAYGPYQIWHVYFLDAKEYDKSIKGTWEDCLVDKQLSEKVIKAYISRYLPKNGTVEMAARIHNGGPKGYKKEFTKEYWQEFKKIWDRWGNM